MTGFNHTLAGSIVSLLTPAPLVPLVAFGSHFILDSLPHFGNDSRFIPFNRRFQLLLLTDALLCFVSLFFSWWLFPDKWFILSVGAFFSTLPDFLWLLRGRISWLAGFFQFAEVIQWAEHQRGWLMELLYGLCFVAALIWLHH